MFVRSIWDDEDLSEAGRVIGNGYEEGTVLVIWGDDTSSVVEDMADLRRV